MSWDLDKSEARELAEEYLAAKPPPTDDIWVITTVVEREWGWIISWVNQRAIGRTDIKYAIAGGGPYLIDRKTGRVAQCGSAHPPDYYVDLWQRGAWPDIPRPV